MTSLNTQSFSIPTQYHLHKASKSKNGIADIEGILSKQTKDTEGEILFIKGMDISYLSTGYAHINWWHLGRFNPGMVVGFIDWAEKTNDETQVDFRGHLINTDAGRAALDLMEAMEAEGKMMGVSVEGKVVLKDDNTGKVYRSIANGAALATQQVNKDCVASLMKAVAGYVPDLHNQIDIMKAIGVSGNAPFGTNPLITTNLGLLSAEEQLELLANEYPDINRTFLKSVLNKIININHGKRQ